MSGERSQVIVGASLAGARAAETLRAEGFDGRVVLIGAETRRPYERPPLSKQVLRGEQTEEDTFVHSADFYERHGIELRLGQRVTAIDTKAATVTVDRGLDGPEVLSFDRLLLSTGARPRRLGLPGATLDGIHYVRDLDDVASLRASLASAPRVVVVGGGWIGSEVGASIRQLGLDVAIVDPHPTPLAAVLGPEIGSVFRDLHLEHGVEMHLGESVAGFEGDRRVTGVRTRSGAVLPADIVVVGVGVEPRTELARQAGLAIDHGIAVDQHLQSSAPGVFAAGDVAAALHPLFGQRIRVEHWANAMNQGIVAGKNMLGAAAPYDRVPYFFSDQYDLGIEYSGYAPTWDRVVFRGDPATREFLAFMIADDLVVAAMSANVWDVTDALQSIIRARQPIDVARLVDVDVPLDALARAKG